MTKTAIAKALKAAAKDMSTRWDSEQRRAMMAMAEGIEKVEILEDVPAKKEATRQTYTLIECAAIFGETWRVDLYDGRVGSCYVW